MNARDLSEPPKTGRPRDAPLRRALIKSRTVPIRQQKTERFRPISPDLRALVANLPRQQNMMFAVTRYIHYLFGWALLPLAHGMQKGWLFLRHETENRQAAFESVPSTPCTQSRSAVSMKPNLGDVAFFDKADDTASHGLRREHDRCFRIGWWGGNDYLRVREVSYPFGASRVPAHRFQRPSQALNDAPRTQSLGRHAIIVHQRRTAKTVRSVALCVAGSASNACFPLADHSSRACSP